MSAGRRGAALLGILTVAAGLRFARLDRQGLLLFDEGQLILEARETAELLRHGTGTLAGRAGEQALLAGAIGRCGIIFGKPVHNAALAAVLIAAPRLRTDQATLRLSAAAGTATVAAVWWLARIWFGEAEGLLAAMLLAVSPLHVLYSREGLSDALAVLWWCLALALAHAPGRFRGAALWSGVAGGLCVGTSYRLLVLPLAILPFVHHRGGLRRSARWLAGFAVPFLAVEALYRAAAGIAHVTPAAFATGTYAVQLKTLLFLHGGQGFLFRGFGAFPYYLWRWEGAAVAAVTLAAVAAQLTRWRAADVAVNAAWLIPWVVFSAYWDNAPRFFTVLLPLVAVVKARWILAASRRLPRPGPTAVALGLAAALLPLPALVPMIPRPAPYLEATAFLVQAGAPRHLSTNSRLGEAYFGPGQSLPMPPTSAEVRRLAAGGCRWAITDLQVLFGGFDRPEERFATAVWIGAHRRSVLTIPYEPFALAQAVLEQDMTFAEARARLSELEAQHPRLHVFDLSR